MSSESRGTDTGGQRVRVIRNSGARFFETRKDNSRSNSYARGVSVGCYDPSRSQRPKFRTSYQKEDEWLAGSVTAGSARNWMSDVVDEKSTTNLPKERCLENLVEMKDSQRASSGRARGYPSAISSACSLELPSDFKSVRGHAESRKDVSDGSADMKGRATSGNNVFSEHLRVSDDCIEDRPSAGNAFCGDFSGDLGCSTDFAGKMILSSVCASSASSGAELSGMHKPSKYGRMQQQFSSNPSAVRPAKPPSLLASFAAFPPPSASHRLPPLLGLSQPPPPSFPFLQRADVRLPPSIHQAHKGGTYVSNTSLPWSVSPDILSSATPLQRGGVTPFSHGNVDRPASKQFPYSSPHCSVAPTLHRSSSMPQGLTDFNFPPPPYHRCSTLSSSNVNEILSTPHNLSAPSYRPCYDLSTSQEGIETTIFPRREVPQCKTPQDSSCGLSLGSCTKRISGQDDVQKDILEAERTSRSWQSEKEILRAMENTSRSISTVCKSNAPHTLAPSAPKMLPVVGNPPTLLMRPPFPRPLGYQCIERQKPHHSRSLQTNRDIKRKEFPLSHRRLEGLSVIEHAFGTRVTAPAEFHSDHSSPSTSNSSARSLKFASPSASLAKIDGEGVAVEVAFGGGSIATAHNSPVFSEKQLANSRSSTVTLHERVADESAVTAGDNRRPSEPVQNEQKTEFESLLQVRVPGSGKSARVQMQDNVPSSKVNECGAVDLPTSHGAQTASFKDSNVPSSFYSPAMKSKLEKGAFQKFDGANGKSSKSDLEKSEEYEDRVQLEKEVAVSFFKKAPDTSIGTETESIVLDEKCSVEAMKKTESDSRLNEDFLLRNLPRLNQEHLESGTGKRDGAKGRKASVGTPKKGDLDKEFSSRPVSLSSPHGPRRSPRLFSSEPKQRTRSGFRERNNSSAGAKNLLDSPTFPLRNGDICEQRGTNSVREIHRFPDRNVRKQRGGRARIRESCDVRSYMPGYDFSAVAGGDCSVGPVVASHSELLDSVVIRKSTVMPQEDPVALKTADVVTSPHSARRFVNISRSAKAGKRIVEHLPGTMSKQISPQVMDESCCAGTDGGHRIQRLSSVTSDKRNTSDEECEVKLPKTAVDKNHFGLNPGQTSLGAKGSSPCDKSALEVGVAEVLGAARVLIEPVHLEGAGHVLEKLDVCNHPPSAEADVSGRLNEQQATIRRVWRGSDQLNQMSSPKISTDSGSFDEDAEGAVEQTAESSLSANSIASQQAPDWPLNGAHLALSQRTTSDNAEGNGLSELSVMDILSEDIWRCHSKLTQTNVSLTRKLHLRDLLYYTIQPVFPMCGLYIVGSSLNGFGTNSSDMDLCLMITNEELDQRTEAFYVLMEIRNVLAERSWVLEQQLIPAKVPILRIKFSYPFEDIVVDLNANNSVAIRNTHLLCYYSNFDWRVRPLVSVVKEWAKRRDMNDANRSSFTSYSLVLMVIHYLQCGTDPVILPSLQEMYPMRFSQHVDVRTLNASIPLDPSPSEEWVAGESVTLGELLIGFLEYYAFKFDYLHDAISVRLGKKIGRAFVARQRSSLNSSDIAQWNCICIEEPFTFSNTAHSVHNQMVFDAIRQAFVDGYNELKTNHNLDAFLSAPPISLALGTPRGSASQLSFPSNTENAAAGAKVAKVEEGPITPKAVFCLSPSKENENHKKLNSEVATDSNKEENVRGRELGTVINFEGPSSGSAYQTAIVSNAESVLKAQNKARFSSSLEDKGNADISLSAELNESDNATLNEAGSCNTSQVNKICNAEQQLSKARTVEILLTETSHEVKKNGIHGTTKLLANKRTPSSEEQEDLTQHIESGLRSNANGRRRGGRRKVCRHRLRAYSLDRGHDHYGT